MERTILHCDCNGFYASVESVLNPAYKKVPMAVCGNPEHRHGIILAKNELAKAYGIQTAETIWQAKQKCPALVLAAPHREEYQKYSRIINGIYQEYTDQVEPFGIDESYLDVTGSRGLFGDGETIAGILRERVKKETGLTISVGVSYNKIFAKLGSDYKKPDATTIIRREDMERIVHPLPVQSLLYVGKSAAETLRKLYIYTIGDLARADSRLLESKLGKLGGELHSYANGWDDSPVRSAYEHDEVKSIGNSITFKRDLQGEEDIRLAVASLSDMVAARMRRSGVKCTTVQVTIRNPSFHNIQRQKTLAVPTYLARELAAYAMELIHASWNLNAPIRMLAITGTGLLAEEDAPQGQLSLFEEDSHGQREKQEHLEKTLDAIRGKYGKDSVNLCGVLKNDIGLRD